MTPLLSLLTELTEQIENIPETPVTRLSELTELTEQIENIPETPVTRLSELTELTERDISVEISYDEQAANKANSEILKPGNSEPYKTGDCVRHVIRPRTGRVIDVDRRTREIKVKWADGSQSLPWCLPKALTRISEDELSATESFS
jgi:hypothetical protein